MYLGTQVAARDDSDYEVWAQLSIAHVCADPPGSPHDWTLDALERHRAKVESFGLTLEMVQLPLSSQPIEQSQSPDILLAGPERDRTVYTASRDDDIGAGSEDIVDLLPKTCKVGRQYRRGNFEIRHDRFLGNSVWLASGSIKIETQNLPEAARHCSPENTEIPADSGHFGR